MPLNARLACSPDNMPRPPSKRAKLTEPSSDEVEDRGSSGSEEESFSTSGSDDGEDSSEEVTAYLELVALLLPGILCFPPFLNWMRGLALAA